MSKSGPSHAELLAILWQAYGAEIGLLLQSDDPERARARLYAARKREANPMLSCLQIRLTKDFPEEGNMIIVRGKEEE